MINLPIASNIFQRERDTETNPYMKMARYAIPHTLYACIKYLLHSHTEASKRRHEFISRVLRSEKTQYRVSPTARALPPTFLRGKYLNFVYNETQGGEKKQVTFFTKKLRPKIPYMHDKK